LKARTKSEVDDFLAGTGCYSQPYRYIMPAASIHAISRSALPLILSVPVQARDGIVEYTITAGDSIFGIAQKFDLKPDTILWANYDILNDDPHMISIGLTLKDSAH
jgi:hypothetical protein